MNLWPEWMRAETASEYSGLARSTLYALSSSQAIPTYHPGSVLLFKRTDLDAYIEKTKKEAI